MVSPSRSDQLSDAGISGRATGFSYFGSAVYNHTARNCRVKFLSAGMAVDANIIISERISEELKKGNSVRTAVKNGYKRAFSSVLDGNVTTAVVAGILMVLGSGTMLSFGYTLLTGVIINLLAGVWMSRYMLNSVIRYKIFNQENGSAKESKKRF
mgnify:CR=1 FL=1